MENEVLKFNMNIKHFTWRPT